MKTKYRLKIETDIEGQDWCIPQRRICFIWFSYS